MRDSCTLVAGLANTARILSHEELLQPILFLDDCGHVRDVMGSEKRTTDIAIAGAVGGMKVASD